MAEGNEYGAPTLDHEDVPQPGHPSTKLKANDYDRSINNDYTRYPWNKPLPGPAKPSMPGFGEGRFK